VLEQLKDNKIIDIIKSPFFIKMMIIEVFN
ncbi:MAG: hypothetical protein RIT11_1123, partial [Pseudomonadota bacterium]